MENVLQMLPMIEKLLNYGAATLCTLALLIGVGWHFWKIKPALDSQNQLILNNTLATQSLSDSTRATTAILDKVSDKLIAHDERSLAFITQCGLCAEGINYLKVNAATREDIIVLHNRLEGAADKADVNLIHRKLDEITDDAKTIANQVNRIAGKIGC